MREHNALVRGFGLREIGAELGILNLKHPTPWVWARVAGDALDLASLLMSLGPNNRCRGSTAAAFLSVAAITVVDILTARSLKQQGEYRRHPRRDYRDRSGFKRSPDQMRGAAQFINRRNATAKRA